MRSADESTPRLIARIKRRSFGAERSAALSEDIEDKKKRIRLFSTRIQLHFGFPVDLKPIGANGTSGRGSLSVPPLTEPPLRPPAALQPAARLTCPGLSSSHDPGVCPRDQGLHLRPSELLKFLPSWEGLMEMLDQSLEGSVR